MAKKKETRSVMIGVKTTPSVSDRLKTLAEKEDKTLSTVAHNLLDEHTKGVRSGQKRKGV